MAGKRLTPRADVVSAFAKTKRTSVRLTPGLHRRFKAAIEEDQVSQRGITAYVNELLINFLKRPDCLAITLTDIVERGSDQESINVAISKPVKQLIASLLQQHEDVKASGKNLHGEPLTAWELERKLSTGSFVRSAIRARTYNLPVPNETE